MAVPKLAAMGRLRSILARLTRDCGPAGTGGAPAESLNPRAYELAADGVFTVAQPRAEQTERLGGSVATFTTPGELEERVRTHLADAWRRRRTAEALPALVAEDTYHHRAAHLVAHLS